MSLRKYTQTLRRKKRMSKATHLRMMTAIRSTKSKLITTYPAMRTKMRSLFRTLSLLIRAQTKSSLFTATGKKKTLSRLSASILSSTTIYPALVLMALASYTLLVVMPGPVRLLLGNSLMLAHWAICPVAWRHAACGSRTTIPQSLPVSSVTWTCLLVLSVTTSWLCHTKNHHRFWQDY